MKEGGLDETTYRQASQMENALARYQQVNELFTKNPKVKRISLPVAVESSNPLRRGETYQVELTRDTLAGLSRVIFARYTDLVEGDETILADDILSQYPPGWPDEKTSPENSETK